MPIVRHPKIEKRIMFFNKEGVGFERIIWICFFELIINDVKLASFIQVVNRS